MAEERVRRRLAAILAADIVGYSRLMEADEEETLARLRSLRSGLIDPKISEYGGRIFKTTGDGILAEFPSAVDAVRHAVDVQRAMAENNSTMPKDTRIDFRVGISLGDVMVAGDDLFGNGVNVAARLEGLSDPGGICISGNVQEHLGSSPDIFLEDMGEIEVKNIARPVKAYRVLLDGLSATVPDAGPRKKPIRTKALAVAAALALIAAGSMLAWLEPWQTRVEAASVERMAYPLPQIPSIAVLPFENTSDDAIQEHLADGLTEDIITDLSKISGIFVVGGNSTFRFKGKRVDARQVAEAFGIRYVLFGNIRRAGQSLQVRVRLIDALNGRQLWSDRFDRELKDVFAVQAEVTQRIVKSLAVTLTASETERIYRKYTTSIEAYELFLRARRTVLTPSRTKVAFAEKLFRRVIEIDPEFAGGYAGLSLNYSMKARFGFGTDPVAERKLSLDLAKKAVQTDKNFAWSYIALGGAHLAHRDPDAAVDSISQALVIQPNGYEENLWMGFYAHFAGQSALAVQHLDKANRISPTDTVRKISFMAMAYLMNGDYQKSVDLMRERIRKYPVGNPIPYVYLAAGLTILGNLNEAKAVAAKFRDLNPNFRLGKWGYINLYKSRQSRERLYEAAKQAGIPE